jgi:hypothetical protein
MVGCTEVSLSLPLDKTESIVVQTVGLPVDDALARDAIFDTLSPPLNIFNSYSHTLEIDTSVG